MKRIVVVSAPHTSNWDFIFGMMILFGIDINAKYLIEFLEKIEDVNESYALDENNYRSTHPLVQNRIEWINSSLENYNDCNYDKDKIFQKKFELLKAKLHGFTHPHYETEAIYNSMKDVDLYATAAVSYTHLTLPTKRIV